MSAGPEYPRPTKRLSDRDRASMLRVDQAGEFGATRIYAGQLAVMGDRHPAGSSPAWRARKSGIARPSMR